MTLHILKLCVGADSVEDLENYIESRYRIGGDRLELGRPYHTTRMVPKRESQVLDGGSLYWVIKGNVQCRQRLHAITPTIGQDGIPRCNLVLERKVIRTQWQPRRAFQGWRYLEPADAPDDLKIGEGPTALPPNLRAELAGLGLL
jgi:hypothetical protein